MRRMMATVAVTGLLAVGGCGTDGGKVTEGTPRTDATMTSSTTSTTTVELPADAETEPTATVSTPASLRQAAEYEDGLQVQITRIKQAKISDVASGGRPGGPMTVFTVHHRRGLVGGFAAPSGTALHRGSRQCLTTAEAAALAGWPLKRFHSEMTRVRGRGGPDARAPREAWPDQRTALWVPDLVRAALASRPGRGVRTDLQTHYSAPQP